MGRAKKAPPAAAPPARPDDPPIGSKVGARRWPNYGNHPDGWGRPWSGIVIARHDPRAWIGSIAFSHAEAPSPAEVLSHCLRHWPTLQDKIPVVWTFRDAYGKEYEKVYWEPVGGVWPYAEDLQAWLLAKAEARGLSSEEKAA